MQFAVKGHHRWNMSSTSKKTLQVCLTQITCSAADENKKPRIRVENVAMLHGFAFG